MGQDLLRLELGGPPKGGEKQQGGQQPKAPASDGQSTSSDPKPQKGEGKSEQESPPHPPLPKREPEPSKEESKTSTPPKEPPKQKDPPSKPQEPKFSKPEPKDAAPLGNREERRVSLSTLRHTQELPTMCKGENESYALAHLRASEAVSEYRGFSDNIQRSGHVEPYAVPQIV